MRKRLDQIFQRDKFVELGSLKEGDQFLLAGQLFEVVEAPHLSGVVITLIESDPGFHELDFDTRVWTIL